ncbi:MAG: FtsX-like permease family protein [Planctomycetaceae bacterium]|nr:FtsX-like permease family protein [Planctomycetales bacterium]MCB9874859.1 FtsX-like permease family protein [Planctomycetaceae bacterium]
MYKLLLSWRYLRTRYIALASIISVTLGVATLIVVNSVMAGFSQEMHSRLHGILSDIVLESHNLDGFADPQWHMDQIRKICGDDIVGMTPVIHVPALLRIPFRGDYHTRQINLIGVDKTTYAEVSDFSQYLLHPENRRQLSFILRDSGYAPGRKDFPPSGWEHRRMQAAYEKAFEEQRRELERETNTGASPSSAPPADPYASAVPSDPYSTPGEAGAEGDDFDPAIDQNTGIILGIATCSIRGRDADDKVRDYYLSRPGDDVQVYFPNAGSSPKPVSCSLTVVDLYESKMSEYDATFAFMPIERLQELRGMFDPLTNTTYVTSIQMKLRPGADLNGVRDKLRAAFPADQYPYRIETWRDLQGPLLAAVHMETTILNILLFLIIAVAGFGILATFFMIVVEKTRDIGILKALGAPSGGVMSIFLSYGVSLGAVGSGVGLVLGLLFVIYINDIALGLELITGREVFDPTVYYFQEIPTSIQPTMVVGVMVGSILIAVLASVLPAIRAARLHPVAALRYE